MAALCEAQVFDKYDKFIQYSFCGKVIILNIINGIEVRGYILEETTCWKVQLENNDMIHIPSSAFNNDINMWMFEDHVYTLIVYHIIEVCVPICMFLSNRGILLYTTHRHVCVIGVHTRNRPRTEVCCCS